MFDTLIALSTVGIQLFIVVTIVAWIAKASFATWVGRNSSWIMKVLFLGSVAGSLIYSEVIGFAPCILCWYQRLAIYPIALLLFTTSLSKSALLRLQVLILSSAGLAVALFHNIITWFPDTASVCGTTGTSCTVLYVFKFGYITIPMMSLTVLLAGIIVTLLASRFPHDQIAEVK